MAKSTLVHSPALTMSPHTPDAAQLRMIALSVAEAALDSPNMNAGETVPSPLMVDSRFDNPSVRHRLPSSSLKSGLGRELWNVAELAVQRRQKENSSPALQPVSIGAEHDLTRSLRGLNISTLSQPRMTRSADPSPVKTSFDHLDQTRSPPVFVPRSETTKPTLDIAAQRVSPPRVPEKDRPARGRISPIPALRARIEKSSGTSIRHTMRLPSLAQITAKMKAHHRRRSSLGDIPHLQQTPPRPSHDRKISAESVESLQTPIDENPSNPRVVSASTTPVTELPPASPAKESRLAPLIRERTASRAARPRSMPPLNGYEAQVIQAQMSSFESVPQVQVITPTPELDVRSPTAVSFETGRLPLQIAFPPILPGIFSPTKTQLLEMDRPLCTPPPRPRSFIFATPSSSSTLASGSGSSVTSSPTLSVPIITCTPAPERTMKNGVEQDSDEEGEDVVVFDGREQEEERAKRGDEMRRRLSLRRGSE